MPLTQHGPPGVIPSPPSDGGVLYSASHPQIFPDTFSTVPSLTHTPATTFSPVYPGIVYPGITTETSVLFASTVVEAGSFFSPHLATPTPISSDFAPPEGFSLTSAPASFFPQPVQERSQDWFNSTVAPPSVLLQEHRVVEPSIAAPTEPSMSAPVSSSTGYVAGGPTQRCATPTPSPIPVTLTLRMDSVTPDLLPATSTATAGLFGGPFAVASGPGDAASLFQVWVGFFKKVLTA